MVLRQRGRWVPNASAASARTSTNRATNHGNATPTPDND